MDVTDADILANPYVLFDMTKRRETGFHSRFSIAGSFRWMRCARSRP